MNRLVGTIWADVTHRGVKSKPELGGQFYTGGDTVYNLVNKNELTMIKIGRRSLITDESIKALMDRKVAEANNRSVAQPREARS